MRMGLILSSIALGTVVVLLCDIMYINPAFLVLIFY